MKPSFTLHGDKELVAALRKLAAEQPQKAAGALYRRAELIMGRSKDKFCPVKTGNLKGTGHVELPQISGKKITVDMVYGGPAASYATTVHERMGPYHPDGRGPKYLERPYMEAASTLLKDLAGDLQLG